MAETTVRGQERLHLDYIDGFRAIAALYVVCVHLLPRSWGENSPVGPLRLLAKVLSQGHFAVTAFIVVSGFCLMLPVIRGGMTLRGGTTVFFKRRFWRIAPPFYLAFVASALLLQLGKGLGAAVPAYYPTTQVTAAQVLGHLTLLQTLIPGGTLPNNGVLWSITVECLIYLWFPLLVLLWRRLGATRATVFYVAAGYAFFLALRQTPLAPVTPQYLGAFAIGALAASIAYAPVGRWLEWRGRLPWHLIAFGIFGAIAGLCILAGWEHVLPYLDWLDLPIALSAAALLIGASLPGKNRVRQALQWKPLVALGAFSFSLYMIHYPLADIICRYLIEPLHLGQYAFAAAILVFAIPLILIASYGFYHAFERPFHAVAKRIV
ncbi:MAG: acyltransferase [Cytophagales bacterium]|nr:acyltransferase [Armatimonadota bacterium]